MEVEPQPQSRRRGVLVAVLATVIALPLLLIDNMSGDTGDPERPAATPPPVQTVVVPVDRPASGPPKGISVVTTSTTSSTLPITTTTTTIAGES